MSITIQCKKTTEITDREIAEIYELFFLIFGKSRSPHLFRQQFENTSRLYSYHAIAKDGDLIVGHNVYVPFDYLFDHKLYTIALSVDAMVHPQYRGQGIYERLAIACENSAQKDGCVLRIGFPNENSYPIQIRKFHYKHIGELTTYCLPIKIGGLKHSLRFLDCCSKIFAKTMIVLSSVCNTNTTIVNPRIAVKRPDYDSLRFSWFDGKYERVKCGDFNVVYKVSFFNGVKAAFILDIYPLSAKYFDKAVKCVYERVKSEVPVILYVGNLTFIPRTMIKIPDIFAPKHFHVVGKVLNDALPDNSWIQLKNWNINLSSFDLL